MGLLTAGKAIFDKRKKKKDLISQASLLTMMEQSQDSKEFYQRMDDFLKNKDKQQASMNDKLESQTTRLDLSDSYIDSLPTDEGLTQTKQIGTMIGAGLLALGEQAASAYMDIQVMKQRDVTKQARYNRVKAAASRGVGLIGAVAAGAVVGGPIGAAVGGLIYVGYQAISEVSSRKKEQFEIEEANKEAATNRLTLGDIASRGNRENFR